MLQKKLKEARGRLGLSLYSVETFTGIDNSNLHKYESGKLSPSNETLRTLSNMYNIPFEQLKAWKILSKSSPEVIEYLKKELCR